MLEWFVVDQAKQQVLAEEAAVREHAQLVHALKVQQRQLREQHVAATAHRHAGRLAQTQRRAAAHRLVRFIERDNEARAIAEQLAALQATEAASLDKLAQAQRHHQAVFNQLVMQESPGGTTSSSDAPPHRILAPSWVQGHF